MIAVCPSLMSLQTEPGWDHTPDLASSPSIRARVSSRTFRNARRRSSWLPAAFEGSGKDQCKRSLAHGKTGQASFESSQTVNDEIQGFSEVAIQRLRLLGGDIHPDLSHDRDRLRPGTRRLSPGAEHLETVPGYAPQQPFGHQGAGRV